MHISITRVAPVGKLVIIKQREEVNEILSRVYHANYNEKSKPL